MAAPAYKYPPRFTISSYPFTAWRSIFLSGHRLSDCFDVSMLCHDPLPPWHERIIRVFHTITRITLSQGRLSDDPRGVKDDTVSACFIIAVEFGRASENTTKVTEY
jgi:hypothetical protein